MPEPIFGEHASTPRAESNPVRNLSVRSESGPAESEATTPASIEWPTAADTAGESAPSPEKVRGINFLIEQVDRLLEKTKVLRESTGLTYKDAQKASNLPGFAASRSNLQKLRKELASLKESRTEVSKEELQRLRTRVANHINRLRASVKEMPGVTAQPKVESDGAVVAGPVEAEPVADVTGTETTAPADIVTNEEGDQQATPAGATEVVAPIPAPLTEEVVVTEKDGVAETQARFRAEFEEVMQQQQALIQSHPELRDLVQNNLISETAKKFKELIGNRENLIKEYSRVVSDLSLMQRQLETMKSKVEDTNQEVTVPVEKKAYQERAELKASYKATQKHYLAAYENYQMQQAERAKNEPRIAKLAFWRKENFPEELVEAKAAFDNASFKYADELMTSMGERFLVGYSGQAWSKENPEWGNKTQERREKNRVGLKAGLANRFVVQAAHEKLKIEQAHLPEGAAGRTLENMQSFFKKHGRTIKVVGYVTVVGIGTLAGGVAGAAFAAGGKEISARLAAGGAVAGAVVGGLVGQRIVGQRERARDTTAATVRASFNLNRMNLLRDDYEGKIRGFEKAKKNQKYYTAGGAILGGVAGGAIGGQLDLDSAATVATDLPTEGLAEGVAEVGVSTEVETGAPETTNLNVGQSEAEVDSKVEANSLQVNVTEYTPAAPMVEPGEAPMVSGVTEAESAVEPVLEEQTLAPETTPVEVAPLVPTEIPPALASEAVVPTTPVESAPAAPSEEPVVEETPEIPEMPYTFVDGEEIDTVSEALFESWKADPELLGESMSKTEFLAKMYTAIAELEKDPAALSELLDRMGVDSGDFGKVQAGQTVNLQPFYEHLKANY